MSELAKKIAETTEVTADELAEIRDLIVNANKPVLDAIGNLVRTVEGMREDFAAHQASTNDQISRLRKKIGNGPPSTI